MTSRQGLSHERDVWVFRAGREWWTNKEGWSVVIPMVYGDTSGPEEEGILTAGCYLGKETNWLDAIAEWSGILGDADVREYHATDFYAAGGKFNDDKWRHDVPGRGMIVGGDYHNTFAKRFAGVAMTRGLIGFAVAMDFKAFQEVLAPELAKERREHLSSDPKTYAIMLALKKVGDFLAQTTERPRNKFQIILEEEQGAWRFPKFFYESKARKERWTRWYETLTPAPKSFTPLQLADLLAHEAWRRAKEWVSESPRDIRKSFRLMLERGTVEVDWLGREEIETNAAKVRALLERYPDGLEPPDTANNSQDDEGLRLGTSDFGT